MCEIFPEVESCCGVCSIRVGMIFIAVLSISTGAVSLGVAEQRTGVGYDQVITIYSNASKIREPKAALSQLSNLIKSCVVVVSVIYMAAGVFLLFSTLGDQEGFAQLFVWLIFLNIVIGAALVFAVGFECIMQSRCLLGHMDWLSASTSLILMLFYLMIWFYFISVANSYVLNAHV